MAKTDPKNMQKRKETDDRFNMIRVTKSCVL